MHYTLRVHRNLVRYDSSLVSSSYRIVEGGLSSTADTDISATRKVILAYFHLHARTSSRMFSLRELVLVCLA